MTSAREQLAAAARDLRNSGARTELLVARVRPRPVLGVPRAERLVPIARVWRLGVLLVAEDGRVWSTGTIIRASDPGHSALQSRSATERRELRVMAQRARIPDGETIDVDARELDLDAVPLPEPFVDATEAEAEPLIRWAPHAAATPVPLAAYLAERIELLRHPPEGSTPGG